MKLFFISLKLLRKHICTTLIVIAQIILSLISLSSLVVFIFDNQDNVRAIEELPIENTSVLTLFPYYDMNFVEEALENISFVESVGKVGYNPDAFCNGKVCNFVTYNDIIIKQYNPSLSTGHWLTEDLLQISDIIPAVVSADMGLHIGDTVNVSITKNCSVKIFVQGILKKPTQYLLPDSFADPEYFRADMIISNAPAVIVSAEQIESLSAIGCDSPILSEIQYAQSCFIFSNEEYDTILASDEIQRLGSITPVLNIISRYKSSINDLIIGQMIIFAVFLFLSITGVISSNVIQNYENQRTFTIYYLLGMSWKQNIEIEFLRNSLIVLMTILFCCFLGKIGVFPLYWLNKTRVVVFFIIVLLYVSILFAVVSAVFLKKLMHQDISLSLKNLHQGE